ncbi:FecR family protein [Pedobacter sp. N36a]|uniref:FecR family protein n=1 Tax=Pedobacter sp. N36a TaxID=2767996 RepID=UPI0016571FF7|nr:FecR family protein [Pedobacter sp. N36a]MBC8987840.1 FecR family protein [Pedobacter sp. N36a]
MQAKELLDKYKAGNCTDAEKAIVETWYLKFSKEGAELASSDLEAATDRIWDRLPIHETAEMPVKKTILWPRIGSAAAVLLVAGIALYLFSNSNASNKLTDLSAEEHYGIKKPILPGGNKAVLTLGDGQQITLDEAGNGKLAEQSGITITKAKDGQLVYTVSAVLKSNALKTAMNTIATPKGGQYQINLPDGTKVWLNAASSLRYPTAFTGENREVSLTGEAYFEVAKANPSQSFKVSTGTQTVEVLGTHFNINAYTDEPSTKTTLLEGAVKVFSKEREDRSLILKPGQQSAWTGSLFHINYGKEKEAVAWKNGVFKFEDADLESVMRSVARWYDLEVTYEGALPARQFSGEIDRNSNLSQVLDILSFFKVHFRVNGKQIIVSP